MSGEAPVVSGKSTDDLLNNPKITTEVVVVIDDLENDDKMAKAASQQQHSLAWFGFTFPEETHNAPQLSYLRIFGIFFWFGCRAFGGPIAQINMMKDELVLEQKWITSERFNRVFAVYQVLPGPEATELACYFGILCGGRFGAFLGGLGFIMPGTLLMLLWSWIYVEYGDVNPKVQDSFHCLQVVVSAYIIRATYKLGEHALYEKESKIFNWAKGVICIFCFLTAVINLNFFISLFVSGVMNALFESQWKYGTFFSFLLAAATLGFYYLYVNQQGIPGGSMVGGSVSGTERSLKGLFELGIIAGMISFGGAYTTLPFIYEDAVVINKWLSGQEFLDSLAITNILPTPLVSFITMVGFIGAGILGAIVMTIGIYLPAFSFTIIGHSVFEACVDNRIILPFLDGVSAAVIGLLAVTALVFLKASVKTGIDATVFFLAYWGVFHFTDKYTQPIGIIVAAIAGQVLYHLD